MDARIILGRILQRLIDTKKAQADGFKSFKLVHYNKSSIIILREKGTEAVIPFKKLLVGIEAFQSDPSLYDRGPSSLRPFGLTHITSPIYALLHLLNREDFKL